LLFWCHNASGYPVMSETVRWPCCMSVSSAQSERDFSSLGSIITDARNDISVSKIEAIELVQSALRAGIVDWVCQRQAEMTTK
jgi:hypothetical protein